MSRPIAQQLIAYAKGMGQMTDERTCNLGFGYFSMG